MLTDVFGTTEYKIALRAVLKWHFDLKEEKNPGFVDQE